MQILRRELGQLLVDLLARDAARLERLGHFVVTEHVADDGDVGCPLIEALVDCRLRRYRPRESRHRDEGGHNKENEDHTLGHLKNLLYSPALPADRARGAPATASMASGSKESTRRANSMGKLLRSLAVQQP